MRYVLLVGYDCECRWMRVSRWMVALFFPFADEFAGSVFRGENKRIRLVQIVRPDVHVWFFLSYLSTVALSFEVKPTNSAEGFICN
jgi:hypothetical protein